jgi:hypothetical protein
MQPLDLEIDRNLSPTATAKAAGLSELAAQFAIGAFQQRSSAHELAGDAPKGREGNCLFKIPLQGCHGFWCWLRPGVHHRTQALASLGWRLGLINGTGLRKPLLALLPMCLSAEVFARFVGDIAQFVKDYEHISCFTSPFAEMLERDLQASSEQTQALRLHPTKKWSRSSQRLHEEAYSALDQKAILLKEAHF